MTWRETGSGIGNHGKATPMAERQCGAVSAFRKESVPNACRCEAMRRHEGESPSERASSILATQGRRALSV